MVIPDDVSDARLGTKAIFSEMFSTDFRRLGTGEAF